MQINLPTERFIRFFKDKNINTNHHFLVAVSGGLDSVTLCELCKQAAFHFTIAHCNFKLRGAESERDEQFVKELGTQYGVNVLIKAFDTTAYAAESGLSVQEAARKLRYQWFTQLREEHGFAFILLAHHADDHIETLLMNFFRGTGLQGVTGIPEWNKDTFALRPLSGMRRPEIAAFAKEFNLQWVEDSSNDSVKYSRNFFRHEIIPAIKKIFPQAEENLLDNIERFKKINLLYQSSVEQLKQKLYVCSGNEVRIPILQLLKYRQTSLTYEIIKDFGFGEKQVDEVLKLTEAASGKFVQNDEFQIIKHRNWLVIAPKTSATDTIAIEKDEKTVSFGGGILDLKILKADHFTIDPSPSVAQLDLKYIEFPLLLRKWKAGDYFYPLGMRKKKKLSRFFIDQKLAKNQKENIWVVESNQKIIWVAGMRIDDRFKISPSTKQLLQLSLTSP